MEKSIRYRINISTSVKGVKTYECTVDAENYEMSDVIRKSDELVAILDKKYPSLIENK